MKVVFLGATKGMGRALARLLAERELTLELSDRAVARVAEAGYDPIYGARPLKRALQRHLEDPAARRVLAGELPAGSRLVVDRGDLVGACVAPRPVEAGASGSA